MSAGGAAVLIVEDDADISGIVADHLERAGYACSQAFSGTEARLVLERAAAAGTADPSAPDAGSFASAPFDVVVCDLMLPGMPGSMRSHTTTSNGAEAKDPASGAEGSAVPAAAARSRTRRASVPENACEHA